MADEQNRWNQIDRTIDELFGHLADDEIEILEQSYSKSITTMIIVTKVGVKVSQVMELKRNFEYRKVLFPVELGGLLLRDDVFFTTMGFRDGKWHVIHLSPLYRTQI